MLPRDLVWKVFTQRDHLMKWWGPKGFKMIVGNLDLKPGGIFHYGMQAPDGSEMWGKWVFREVVKPERLVFISSFSDKDAGLTRHPMAPTWPIEMLATATFIDRTARRCWSTVWSRSTRRTKSVRRSKATSPA